MGVQSSEGNFRSYAPFIFRGKSIYLGARIDDMDVVHFLNDSRGRGRLTDTVITSLSNTS